MQLSSLHVALNHLGLPILSFFDRRIEILPALLAVGIAVVAGISTQALTPSPYALGKRCIAQGVALVERFTGKGEKVDLAPPKRTLDTALLPLLKQIVTLPTDSGVAPIGGGITTRRNDIIIANRLGAFFKVSGRGAKIENLVLPPLPNHVTEYLQFAGRINVNGFRVHDMKSRQEQGGLRLFVSFENFLPDRKATDLALATILLSDSALTPIGLVDGCSSSIMLTLHQPDA